MTERFAILVTAQERDAIRSAVCKGAPTGQRNPLNIFALTALIDAAQPVPAATPSEALTAAQIITALEVNGAEVEDLRFDLIINDDVSERWPVEAMGDAAAFVTGLYHDGFQNEGDPAGWPFATGDTVAAGVVDGEAVIVGYGPDPSGKLTFAAYVVIAPDATRWRLDRDGLEPALFATYGDAFAEANGPQAIPFKIIPPLSELPAL